jgi:hypothetical protein
LLIYAIQYQDEFALTPQHGLQMRDERADVLAPSGVCFVIAVYCIRLQALMHCRSGALQQVPSRDTLITLYDHVLLTARFQVRSDDVALSRGLGSVCDQGRRTGETRLLQSSVLARSSCHVHTNPPKAQHRAGVVGTPYMATAPSTPAAARPAASPGPSLSSLTVGMCARAFDGSRSRFALMQVQLPG